MRLIWRRNIFRARWISVGLRSHQMWHCDKTPQGCVEVVWQGESHLINIMGPVWLLKDMIGCGSMLKNVTAKSWAGLNFFAPEVCLSFWMRTVAVTVRAKTNRPDWAWVGKSCISAALGYLVWMQLYFYRQKVCFFTALRLNTTLM